MRGLTYIIVLLMLVGCYNVADKPIIETQLPQPTTTIDVLRNDIVGRGGVTITEDICLYGRVVSSDAESNFYGSIVVEDDGGAVEVMIGRSLLDAAYPPGLLVALCIKGCYADYSRGVLQVGAKAAEYDYMPVDYLGSPEATDRVVHRSCSVEPVAPRHVRIARLCEDMCGMLLSVDSLVLVGSSSIDTLAGDLLADAVWSGYALFKDRTGDSIAVYTQDYARYANNHIPTDSISIVGILQRSKYTNGRECYFLKMRYESDCTTY
ncbi:MAG: hypothetical protein IKZ32_02860 [Alistipes sp.]|nr:hypothetical protein [Alistipes sp.]